MIISNLILWNVMDKLQIAGDVDWRLPPAVLTYIIFDLLHFLTQLIDIKMPVSADCNYVPGTSRVHINKRWKSLVDENMNHGLRGTWDRFQAPATLTLTNQLLGHKSWKHDQRKNEWSSPSAKILEFYHLENQVRKKLIYFTVLYIMQAEKLW